LVHGRLTPRSVVLTAGGVVKLTGAGEPAWLSGAAAEPTVADDLAALGELAAAWAAVPPRRKGAKPPKPLPPALQAVVARLGPDAGDRFTSAAEFLEELERAGAELPDGGEAWEKLLRHAAERATEGVAWRKSA
jgi:hypothetical protein